MMRYLRVAACVAACALTSGHARGEPRTAAPSSAHPLKIRIGWAQASQLGPILFQNKALLKHYGRSYVVEPVRFRGTTAQIQALATGDLDMATLTPSGLVFAIRNADLAVRVVADTFHDNGRTHWSSPFLVRRDSGIERVEDLRGRRIATNAAGSLTDTAMRTMLRRHGLTDADYTVVEAPFTAMPALLADGKVDLIVALPQFARRIDKTKTRTLFSVRDAVGAQQTLMWVMRAETIAQNRAALVDYWEDHIRALRWFLDPRHREEALRIMVAFTGQPREAFEHAFTTDDFYRSPDAQPSLEGLRRGIANAVEGGVLDRPLADLENYLDLSLIEEAKRRIESKKTGSLQ